MFQFQRYKLHEIIHHKHPFIITINIHQLPHNSKHQFTGYSQFQRIKSNNLHQTLTCISLHPYHYTTYQRVKTLPLPRIRDFSTIFRSNPALPLFLFSALIININPKKSLMVLGLFGYYPWHYGACDYFLDSGLETLAYLGDLVILSDYFVWSY